MGKQLAAANEAYKEWLWLHRGSITDANGVVYMAFLAGFQAGTKVTDSPDE